MGRPACSAQRTVAASAPGHVPRHGVTEAAEVFFKQRAAVRKSGLGVDGAKDGVVTIEEVAQVGAVFVPLRPAFGELRDGSAMRAHVI